MGPLLCTRAHALARSGKAPRLAVALSVTYLGCGMGPLIALVLAMGVGEPKKPWLGNPPSPQVFRLAPEALAERSCRTAVPPDTAARPQSTQILARAVKKRTQAPWSGTPFIFPFWALVGLPFFFFFREREISKHQVSRRTPYPFNYAAPDSNLCECAHCCCWGWFWVLIRAPNCLDPSLELESGLFPGC